jgi:DNA-binding response OmpR family regulator
MFPMTDKGHAFTSPAHPKPRRRSRTRVGALEQQSLLARKTMPHLNPPGACVAVLTSTDTGWQQVRSWVTDELTSVIRLRSPDDLGTLDQRPDVVIAERAMLGDCGVALRRIRQRRLTSTLVVTGARDLADVEHLLDCGADDAIPTDWPVLRARLGAAVRRARALNASLRVAVGDIVYDRERRLVVCAGTIVRLTRTEESLLDCLFNYMPRPVSVADLSAFVWGGEMTPARRNLVHVYVGYLRRKLRGSRQMEIRTVRGVGYELAARQDVPDRP